MTEVLRSLLRTRHRAAQSRSGQYAICSDRAGKLPKRSLIKNHQRYDEIFYQYHRRNAGLDRYPRQRWQYCAIRCLGAASRVTPNDIVGALQKALLIWPEFPQFMKKIKPRDARGNLDRALSGYVTERVAQTYVFAIFCQDLEQRKLLT